jgi:hypothetical protein
VKVKVKTFDIELAIKANGLELEVRTPDDRTQVGDCYVTMTGLIWCAGKVHRPNGVKLSWSELGTILASPDAKKAALKAAKSV